MSKLDPEIKNAETYGFIRKILKIIRPRGKSTNKIFDPLGIKLLTRLKLGFSHLLEYKFRHNFADSLNLLNSLTLHYQVYQGL